LQARQPDHAPSHDVLQVWVQFFQHCLTDSLEHDCLCPGAYVFNCLFGRLISTNLAHVYEGWAIFLLDQICYAHLSMLCNKGSILLIACFTGLFNLLAC
jgi:hypothetical protein